MFMPHPGLNRWVAGRGPCAQALPPHLDQDAAPASRAPTRPRKPPEFPTGQEPPQCPAELGARKHQEDANPEPVSRWKHARTCGPCTVLRAQPRAPLCPGREPGSTGSDRLLPPPPGRRRLRSHGEQGTRLGRRHRRRRCAALVVGPGFHRAGGKPRAADGAECPTPRVPGGRAATTPASAWPLEPPDHPTAELDAALLSQGLREKVGLSCSPVTPPGPGARGPGAGAAVGGALPARLPSPSVLDAPSAHPGSLESQTRWPSALALLSPPCPASRSLRGLLAPGARAGVQGVPCLRRC